MLQYIFLCFNFPRPRLLERQSKHWTLSKRLLSQTVDGDIWNYKTGGFSIVLFVWVAFIGVRIPSHPSRKHRYLLGTCVYCAIKFEQSSLGIIWFILSLSHKTEMHRGTWNMLTFTHAKWVVRLTHDTQSLKTKQMQKSTLKVQTNSKSLKAIKIIGPWFYLHK